VGVCDIELPPNVFENFKLIKAVQEKRPGQSITKPTVFYFSHKSIQDLTLKVEARSDVASVADPYPRTFHRIDIIRGARP
jgi:hypothetical protein